MLARVFVCSKAHHLSEGLKQQLGNNADVINLKVDEFKDGEIAVPCQFISYTGIETVFLVQSFYPNPNDAIIEFILAAHTLHNLYDVNIKAVIPYLCYTRQDRPTTSSHFGTGSPIYYSGNSSKAMLDALSMKFIKSFDFVDLHTEQITGFVDSGIASTNSSVICKKFLDPIKTDFENNSHIIAQNQCTFVAPDVGAIKRNREIQALWNTRFNKNDGLAIIDKHRSGPGSSQPLNLIGDVRDKYCIICDDIADSAGTLCNAADFLMNEHGAASVCALITHGIFSGEAIQKINDSKLSVVYVTNTINQEENETRSAKIQTLDITEHIAHLMFTTYVDEEKI